nr:uncharacterized protein LOC109184751 [Ipomoea trifida]
MSSSATSQFHQDTMNEMLDTMRVEMEAQMKAKLQAKRTQMQAKLQVERTQMQTQMQAQIASLMDELRRNGIIPTTSTPQPPTIGGHSAGEEKPTVAAYVRRRRNAIVATACSSLPLMEPETTATAATHVKRGRRAHCGYPPRPPPHSASSAAALSPLPKTAGRETGADPTAAATTVLRRSDWRVSLRRVPSPPQAHHCCHCFITSCCRNHRTEEGDGDANAAKLAGEKKVDVELAHRLPPRNVVDDQEKKLVAFLPAEATSLLPSAKEMERKLEKPPCRRRDSPSPSASSTAATLLPGRRTRERRRSCRED